LPNTEGVFVPNGWYPGVNNYQNKAMVQEYLKKYGGTPASISSDVAEAYAVGQVVAQAVTKTHSLDNAKLIAELHSGDTFKSVQGPVRFDATGQNTAAQAYLFQWQHGNLVPVFPASQAQAKPEYPKPNWH
ncbi:MAG TPA: ABC transporter substrate-binding protein, partial [Chloroflexota bacterium]|nr:ABC transporter substrate-binding protein [Chloroflexota bacterium]